MAAQPQTGYTWIQALQRLEAGNDRFASGHARFPTVQKEVLAELAKSQQPYATVLGCSDSRVPPELVFDAGFGELFVVRVAGNVLGSRSWARCNTRARTFTRRFSSSWVTKAAERCRPRSLRSFRAPRRQAVSRCCA